MDFWIRAEDTINERARSEAEYAYISRQVLDELLAEAERREARLLAIVRHYRRRRDAVDRNWRAVLHEGRAVCREKP